MLKQIPHIISPELMMILMKMGHGDTITFADANFPAYSNAKIYLPYPGVEITDLLEAVLPFFPLDDFVPNPVRLMKNMDTEPVPVIWKDYETIIKKHDNEQAFHEFDFRDRLEFYKESEKSTAIVQTGTEARYANITLQKGVV